MKQVFGLALLMSLWYCPAPAQPYKNEGEVITSNQYKISSSFWVWDINKGGKISGFIENGNLGFQFWVVTTNHFGVITEAKMGLDRLLDLKGYFVGEIASLNKHLYLMPYMAFSTEYALGLGIKAYLWGFLVLTAEYQMSEKHGVLLSIGVF